MNITELARRLKIPTQQLKDELPKLGFDIGRRAIKIDDAVAEKVVKLWSERQQQRQQQSYVVVERRLGEGAAGRTANREVKLPPTLTPREFAALLGLPATTVIGELFKNGVMASINERIDFDTASIVAQDLGFATSPAEAQSSDKAEEAASAGLAELLRRDSSGNVEPRPPVVVVMGHVDHGKTTLLDAIREANVVQQESGAITQHIGAYQAETKGRKITFLDTPGHEAFSAMRSRGGRLADIAIIVVAADDGLQPQTIEAIEIAQREKLAFLIAINKVDKENADLERVKKALAEINLLPEDWGGKIICVPISAKKREGLPELLDMVLLLADMEKLAADPARLAVGTIIEARLDKGEGPVATALVQAGTLKVGDYIIAGTVAGKVRSMKNFRGFPVTAATPSMPVRVLGLKQVPQAGDTFRVVEDEKLVREVLRNSSHYQAVAPSATIEPKKTETEGEAAPVGRSLNVVLKTDVLGSREAIFASFADLGVAEAQVKVVRTGLGSITQADVAFAEASQGIVLGFHVPIKPEAELMARRSSTFVHTYKVIYDLLDEVKKQLSAFLKPELVRNQLGELVVLKVFRRGKRDMIVGCRVVKGVVRAKTSLSLLRQGQPVADKLTLKEVRLGREVVGEVAEGGECGILIEGAPVVEERDTLEVYHEEIRQRTIGG
ncbi:MAG: translation initiation factor IF-2 [Candidatus Veblenbacteria bacterium]|nr:translation initiation factor IF-2 [Candidatus Veblenbacteria bacterium]